MRAILAISILVRSIFPACGIASYDPFLAWRRTSQNMIAAAPTIGAKFTQKTKTMASPYVVGLQALMFVVIMGVMMVMVVVMVMVVMVMVVMVVVAIPVMHPRQNNITFN